jgi:phosphoribosyl 1,2-cyclic phosphodiesterase
VRARVWGCRGSIASPGSGTLRYGGNTSCVELTLSDGSVAVLDAGTGMRALGDRLVADGAEVVHVLLSHLHLDHLQGLAFFKPLYMPQFQVHLWGPPSPRRSLADRVSAYMSDPLFPVNVTDVPCHLEYHDAPTAGTTIGSAEVWASPVAHRGPTVGYRFEESGRALVYVPDHEPALGTGLDSEEIAWVSGYGLAAGADVMLHDAQYTDDEYPDHAGWGHSSVSHVVEFAAGAGVRQLVLFHHDPAHTDEELEALRARAVQLWGDRPSPPILGFEGMELDLDGDGS